MDIINRFKSLFRKKSLVQDTTLDLIIRGLYSPTTRYETYVWIFASAKKIAETGSQAGFKVIDANGERVDKYESYFRRPSGQTTFNEFIEAVLGMMALYGKAFVIVDGVFIYVLDNRFVGNLQRTYNGFSFEVFDGQAWRVYTQDEAVIIYDTLAFHNLLAKTALEKTAGIGSKIEQLNDNLLERGGFIPGYFTTDQPLTPAQRKAIKEEWEKTYAGYMNAGRPPVLEGGLRLERFGLTPADMQFPEMEKVVLDRVSAVMGVPASLLNKTDKINYATAKVQKELFWESTILPKLKKIEQRINYFVFPLLKIPSGFKFVFDLSDIKALKEDAESKAKVHDIYVRDGVMTINEVREQLGLEPVSYGDYFWGGSNQVPLASKGKGEILAPQSVMIEQKKLKAKEDERTQYWKRFDQVTRSLEMKIYKEMVKEFRKQRKEIKRAIQDYLSGEKIVSITKINEDDLLNNVDFESYITRAQQGLLPIWMASATEGANMLVADLMIESGYDVVNPNTINFIREHTYTVARQINETTFSDLRRHIANAIAEGVEQGLSTDKIAEKILEAVDDVFDIAEGRAFTIARTETARAVNWGQYEFAKNSGLVLKKEWISSRDNVVRPSHREADGQVVDLNAPFSVGGETLEFPGDPRGSAGNTVNCRCTVKYIPEGTNEGSEEPEF